MSAVIWLGIVAVWGFVLIPRWLRHHDGVAEQRSVDRFHTAMRVLARGGAERRYAVGPSGPHRPYPSARRTPSSLARVRARRARRLLALLVAVPVTALLALALGGPWAGVHLVADVALIGYLVFLRRKARTAQRLRAARAARDRRARAARAAWQAALTDPGAAREPVDDEPVVDDEPDTDELPPVAARAGGRRPGTGPAYASAEVAAAGLRHEVPVAVADGTGDADRGVQH